MCHKDDLLMLKSANKSAASYGLMPVKIPVIDEGPSFIKDTFISAPKMPMAVLPLILEDTSSINLWF